MTVTESACDMVQSMSRGRRGGWSPNSAILLLAVIHLSCCFTVSADDQAVYLQQIKPVLQERCYACHGALKQEAGLRLDTVALALRGGDSGTAIQPGDATASLLFQRISAAEASERMPPEGEPLQPQQLTLIKDWIARDAVAPAEEQPEQDPREHWAFKPYVKPAVPTVANTPWVRNPIDAFLAQKYEQQGLTPQPEASRSLLLRRLYLDLIGVPPSLADLTRCEQNPSSDWYASEVERLLEDPRHGERWARHWMDIWRYSDWWGLGDQLRNSQKHIWHWRDWMVESLNHDTPYDEMLRQMLAADELYPQDLQKLRATGYLARNWYIFNRNQWLDETVEHVSKGLLGLTMNCAKCHDHKFDPIEQTDYYKLRAFFEPYHVRMDMVPHQTDLSIDGVPRVFDGLLEAPTYLFIRGDEKQPETSTVMAPGVPDLLAFKSLEIAPISLPENAWDPARRAWVIEAYLAAAQKRVDESEPPLAVLQSRPADALIPASTAEAEYTVAEKTATLAQRELSSLQLRIEALRAMWSAAADAADKVAVAVQSERDVAIVQAEHRLALIDQRLVQAADDKRPAIEKERTAAVETLEAARKAALVAVTATDKVTPLEGARWSPTRFVESRTDDAPVAFSPTSTGRRTALADWMTDPRNPLTARVAVNHLWARHMGTPLVNSTFDFGRNGAPPTHPELLDWLASEFVEQGWSMKHLHRLIVNSAAYRLSSSSAGGEANTAIDPDNRYWWRRNPLRIESQAVRDALLSLSGELDGTMGGPPVPMADQANSRRRSLYFFHSNNERNLFLTTFDEANVKDCYRREQSIVPQQALALLNSQLVLESAQQIAARLRAEEPQNDDAAFVRQAFRCVLCVSPSAAETAVCVESLKEWQRLPSATPEQARTQLVWALLNHNDFVTLR